MGFRQNGSGWGSFQGKTKEQRKREETETRIAELEKLIREQERSVLSRKNLREADNNAIVAQKEKLEDDARELEKLKRQLARMNENGK